MNIYAFYVLLWQLDRLILSYKLHFASPVLLLSLLCLCVLFSCLAKFQVCGFVFLSLCQCLQLSVSWEQLTRTAQESRVELKQHLLPKETKKATVTSKQAT